MKLKCRTLPRFLLTKSNQRVWFLPDRLKDICIVSWNGAGRSLMSLKEARSTWRFLVCTGQFRRVA